MRVNTPAKNNQPYCPIKPSIRLCAWLSTSFLLCYCSMLGDLMLCQLLTQSNPEADLNEISSNGETALYVALQNNHFHLLEYLMSQGGNINSSNKDGSTPLYFVSKNGKKY